MARLAAWSAATLFSATPLALATGQTVRRRWLGRRRRVLVVQRELPFQISNLAIALGHFFPEPLILSLQSLDFLRLTAITIEALPRRTRPLISRPSRPRGTHAAYGTLIVSPCTG
jgi:hypothetical protein